LIFIKCRTIRLAAYTRNHGGVVFASGRKGALVAKKAIETSLFQRITGADWKKALANVWSRPRITEDHQKGPRWSWARNQKGKSQSKWEIPE